MLKFGTLLTSLLALSIGIATPSSPTMSKISSIHSAEGNYSLVEYKEPPLEYPTTSEIWIEPDSFKTKPQLLFKHTNRATCLISSSGRSIAIDYHESSGDGLVFVFSRQANGAFRQCTTELRDLARPALLKFLKNTEPNNFDHFYCHADIWINDRCLLAHLQGNNSGVSWLDPWYFVFDQERGTISRDLNKANQGVLTFLKDN